MSGRRVGFLMGLVGAIVGLAIALWMSYRPSLPPEQAATISDEKPATLRRIRIRHNGDLVLLERRDTAHRWRLTSPVSAPADSAHIDAVMALLRHPSTRRYERHVIDEQKTGLDEPMLVVQFANETPIEIGDHGPSPNSRYIRTAHDLWLVDIASLNGLAWGWSHWMSPALVDSPAELTAIILPHATLRRNDSNGWHVEPAGYRSPSAVAATIRAWRRARALTVVPANRSRARIGRMTFKYADRAPRYLDIIEREPNLVLRDPERSVDYHLAGNRVAPLLDIRHPALDTP